MNKRILELWTQADKLAKDAMDIVPRRSYNDVLMEKFAELILRECKLFCGHDSEGVSAMFKHFGVEE